MKFVEAFIVRFDWNKADMWGLTPLYRALESGQSDIAEIIMQQSNIDYNVKIESGATLGHPAVDGEDVKCVETLVAQETFDCWNFPAFPVRRGDTPIMRALKRNRTEILKVLENCSRVDLDVVDGNFKHLEDIAR